MVASAENRRGKKIQDLLGGTQEDGTAGKYGVGRTDMEESAADSTECSGEETESLGLRRRPRLQGGGGVGGAGWKDANRDYSAIGDNLRESERIGVENGPKGATSGGGATLGATP